MNLLINGSDLEFEPTAHSAGLKKVFIQSSDTGTMLTQFAYGKLFPGDSVPAHTHDSMEEVFYFLKGEGVYKVDQDEYPVFPATVMRIPAGAAHSLVSSGSVPLEFLYFGIAT